MSMYITSLSRSTSLDVLKNKDNWFVFHDFVFHLEVEQHKVERYAFSFSEIYKT